jgi:hypothetical protein
MPPVVIAAAIAAGGAVTGGVINARAAGKAGDKQLQANDAALQFSREQAETAYRSDEANRRANYDQWASSQQRLGSIGELLGFGPREVPAYVPRPDPRLAPSVGQALGGPGGGPSSLDPNAPGSFAHGAPPPDVAAAYDAYVKSNNLTTASQTDPTVNTAIVNHLRSKGFNAQLAPMDSNGHSAGIVVNGQIYQTINGSNQLTPLQPFESRTTSARRPMMGSVGSYLHPQAPRPITPALTMPRPRYGSVGSYLG